MKVLIVSTQLPFVKGGAEILENNLKNALEEKGHGAEIVKIPFTGNTPQGIVEQTLSARLLDLTLSAGTSIDLLVSLKFPAYCIAHPNKVTWLLHQHRDVYDLWGTPYQHMQSDEEGLRVRQIIKNCDNQFLPESKKIFTLSNNVSSRLKKFNGIDSKPLYHPPDNAEELFQGKYEDYVFFPSRISTLKRQDLAIETMKYTKTGVKLILAGRPDNKFELKRIEDLISKNNLDSKVSLMLDISDQKKNELFSNCLGSIFIPYDEDYGYVTLESFYSKKPVITTNDSGGPLEFVDHEKNGFISNPDPQELAKYLDMLYSDKQNSKIMGEKGFKKMKEMKISWDTVVDSLIK